MDDLTARLMDADTLDDFTNAERGDLLELGFRDAAVRQRYHDLAIKDAQRVLDNLLRDRQPKPKPSRWGVLHLHRERVPGCFRCDLREDEADA